jgi:hypothetical protein
MNNTIYPKGNTHCTRDYALAEASSGCVVLEANEWDQSKKTYRRVTLKLSREEAEKLSFSLFRSAAVFCGSEDDQ